MTATFSHLNKSTLILLSIFLAFAFPIKAVSLAFLPFWIWYVVSMVRFRRGVVLIYFFFFLLQLTTTFYHNGLLFVSNLMLSILFLSPLFIFLASKVTDGVKLSSVKSALDIFLAIQIVFCTLQVLSRLMGGWSLDLDFGDVVAGTFRLPFAYKTDASNVMFAFMITLILPLYIHLFGFRKNITLVSLCFFYLILASVNHLYFCIVVSLLLVLLKSFRFSHLKYLIIFVGSLIPIIAFYLQIQPKNANMIVSRLSLVFDSIVSGNLAILGFKGGVVNGFFVHFIENKFAVFFMGFGGGSYSSRASLFLTGEYVSSFPFRNISAYMFENCYALWKALLAAPPWLSGAFNYPYFSVLSLVSEYGIIFSGVFLYMLSNKLKESFRFSPRLSSLMFFIIISASFIDNYLEYFQVMVIFVTFIFALGKSEGMENAK